MKHRICWHCEEKFWGEGRYCPKCEKLPFKKLNLYKNIKVEVNYSFNYTKVFTVTSDSSKMDEAIKTELSYWHKILPKDFDDYIKIQSITRD